MKNQKTTMATKGISKKYNLCNFCSLRLESKKSKNTTEKCFICKDIFQKVDDIVGKALMEIAPYEFSSFETGIIIKPSLIDRDDQIKSQFQIKGVNSIKSSLNNEIAKKLSRKTKTKIKHRNPDLTIKINLKDDSYEINSKPMFVYGRYIKKIRTLAQKQRNCNNCAGKGCHNCSFHGLENFNSVEGKISEFLIRKFNCQQIRINWVGGEEKSSLVLGNGRPFFVKIINPKKRKVNLRRKTILDGIELIELRKILEPPTGQIFFKSKVLILIKTEKTVKLTTLKKIEKLEMPLEIHVDDKKTMVKKIYKINFKKTASNLLNITILADGGIPIKSFIKSSYVSPNLTNLLKTQCECLQFDFKKIDVVS